MLLVEDSMTVLLATFKQWDPGRILRSLAMFWSHWLCTCPAGMAGVSMISWASSSWFWFSSSFTLEHWLQRFEPLILLGFSEVAAIWKAFLLSFGWMCLFALTGTLPTWRKQEKEQRMALTWGRGYCWLGLMASVEGVWPRGGMCKTRKGDGVLGVLSMGRLSLGGFTHLDTSFRPQLIRRLHLVLLHEEPVVSELC